MKTNMHSYSLDTKERKNILLILAVMSVFITFFFSKTLNHYQITLFWWVESPSVLFFYGLLFIIFDNWVWKLFSKIGFIKTPDLNGIWKGILKTSFDEHTSETKASLSIFQRWTGIKIILTTPQSRSCSETASFVLETPEGKYLSYQYLNEPKSGATQTMSIHRGTTRLFFDEKENTLIGEYYSGRDRQNFGSLSFKR